jgi:hypothetical protein
MSSYMLIDTDECKFYCPSPVTCRAAVNKCDGCDLPSHVGTVGDYIFFLLAVFFGFLMSTMLMWGIYGKLESGGGD